jgi:hypothetical protein
MELIDERGRIKSVDISTKAIMTCTLSPGEWPDRGWVNMQTHKPKEVVTVYAWNLRIKHPDGREILRPPGQLVVGKWNTRLANRSRRSKRRGSRCIETERRPYAK